MQDVFYDDAGSDDSPGGIGQRFAQILGWAGAALSLLLVASIIIWAYRLGVRDARDIPVIRALDIPARVQPADPGGTVEPHQGLEVNEILAGSEAQTPADSTLAPVEAALSEEDQPIPVGETQIAALARQAVDDAPVTDATTGVDEDLPLIDQGEAQAEQILQQIARLPSSDMRPRARPSDLRRTSESSGIAVAVEASATEVVPGTRVVQLGRVRQRKPGDDALAGAGRRSQRPAGAEETVYPARGFERAGVLSPAGRGLRRCQRPALDVRGAARTVGRLHSRHGALTWAGWGRSSGLAGWN